MRREGKRARERESRSEWRACLCISNSGNDNGITAARAISKFLQCPSFRFIETNLSHSRSNLTASTKRLNNNHQPTVCTVSPYRRFRAAAKCQLTNHTIYLGLKSFCCSCFDIFMCAECNEIFRQLLARFVMSPKWYNEQHQHRCCCSACCTSIFCMCIHK